MRARKYPAIERVSVREDLSICADLDNSLLEYVISFSTKLSIGIVTYINVQIGVVNINPMDGLAKIDVSHTIIPNVMVVHQAKSCIWKSQIGKLRSHKQVIEI